MTRRYRRVTLLLAVALAFALLAASTLSASAQEDGDSGSPAAFEIAGIRFGPDVTRSIPECEGVSPESTGLDAARGTDLDLQPRYLPDGVQLNGAHSRWCETIAGRPAAAMYPATDDSPSSSIIAIREPWGVTLLQSVGMPFDEMRRVAEGVVAADRSPEPADVGGFGPQDSSTTWLHGLAGLGLLGTVIATRALIRRRV